MTIRVDSATGAAAWAPYLVNGDCSGLEDRERKLADAWAARLAPFYVVDVERDADGEAGAPFFSWSYGIVTGDDCAGGELIEYTLHAPALEVAA